MPKRTFPPSLPLPWSRLKRNRHLHLPEGLRLGDGGKRGAQVLARALCRVRFIPLDHLPKSARRSALLVQLRAWTPFADSGHAAAMLDGAALAFAWDRAAMSARLDAAGLTAEPATLIPETLLLPRQESGVSLHACATGCVGQVWRGGVPVSSRWWAQWPSQEEWLNFQRGAGLAGEEQQLPPPRLSEEPAWLDKPWAQVAGLDELRGQGRLWEHVAVGALALALLAPTLQQARAWRGSDAEFERVSSRKAQLESRVKPIQQAREESEAALASSLAIARLADRPDALALLAHVSRQLPGDGSLLRELEWQGERLRLSMTSAPGVSRAGYVRALESGHWLRDVRETADNAPGAFSLVATVSGKRAPAPTPAQAPVSGAFKP